MSDFRNHYKSSLEDLREARPSIFLAALLFISGIGLGLAHPEWSQEGLSSMKHFAGHLPDKSMPALIAVIFLKNVLAAVLSVVSGPLLGILSFFAAIVNGLLLGAVFSYAAHTHRTAVTDVIIPLLPHGLFELPAMFMAWGLGIWQGIWFFEKNRTGTLRERRNKSLSALLLIIVPLLLVAAIIEGTGIDATRAVREAPRSAASPAPHLHQVSCVHSSGDPVPFMHLSFAGTEQLSLPEFCASKE